MTVLGAALALGLPPTVARAVARHAPSVELAGRPLVAADLDRTLIYSAAALGLDAGGTDEPRLTVTELKAGRPLSYCTRAAEQVIEALARVAEFVPVTTRTLAQFRRVRLTEQPPRLAVVANGGHIMTGDRLDPDWAQRMTARISGSCAPLAQI